MTHATLKPAVLEMQPNSRWNVLLTLNVLGISVALATTHRHICLPLSAAFDVQNTKLRKNKYSYYYFINFYNLNLVNGEIG